MIVECETCHFVEEKTGSGLAFPGEARASLSKPTELLALHGRLCHLDVAHASRDNGPVILLAILQTVPVCGKSLVKKVISAPSPPGQAVIWTPGILLQPGHAPVVPDEVTSLYPPVSVSPMPGEAHVTLDLVGSEVNPDVDAPPIGPQSAEDIEAADVDAVLNHNCDVMVTCLVYVGGLVIFTRRLNFLSFWNITVVEMVHVETRVAPNVAGEVGVAAIVVVA